MKPSRMKALLASLLRAGETVLIVGPPGLGKSEIVAQVADALDHTLLVTHPVVDDPTDYKGMPAIVPRADGSPGATFLPFGDLARMLEATSPTLVFLDDLGQAPPSVQAAVMQLVLARRINGHAVSPHVRFVAATNRRQDRAAVTGLIAPLLDRFTAVLEMEYDPEDWVAWGLENGMPPELLAFARFRPEAMGGGEPPRDMRKTPTPRSVAALGRLVAGGHLDPELLAGAAGEAFATEFLAFQRTWASLPDPAEVHLNPDAAPVPTQPDVLFALMGALAHRATPTTLEATVRYLARVPPEYGFFCMRDATRRDRTLLQTQAFTRWSLSHGNALENR